MRRWPERIEEDGYVGLADPVENGGPCRRLTGGAGESQRLLK